MSNNEEENLGSFYMGKTRQPPAPKRLLPRGVVSALILAAFGVIIWYAYPQSQEKYSEVDIPLVAADKDGYKHLPEDPGGMVVPHQDSTVFDPLEGKSADSVENLTPAAEEPLDRPKASPLVDSQPELNLTPQQEPPAQKDQKDDVITLKAEPLKVEDVTQAAPAVSAPVFRTPAPVVVKTKPSAANKTSSQNAAPASGGVYMQMGSFRDEAAVDKEWSRLKKKHAELLEGIPMRAARADLGAKGIFFRLQAGRVTNARAKEICAAIEAAKSGGCLIVK